MLRNYLKIAWRNLSRHKFYSFLNVFGLSLGLASCLLISLYVIDEIGYDESFSNSDRIFRVNADIRFGGADMKLAVSPDPLAFTLRKDYPQIQQVARLRDIGSQLVHRSNSIQNLREDRIFFADSTFFEVFSLPLIAGDPRKVLVEPNTAVISARNAEKYFGSENPIGKALVLPNQVSYTVTGIMKDLPDRSHLRDLNLLLSMSTSNESREDSWGNHNFNTYILFRHGVNPDHFEKNFEIILQKYTSKWIQAAMGSSLEDLQRSGSYLRYSLMPITDIHLRSNRTAEISANSNIQYVFIFTVVAIFLLIIACVNFMNLATARSFHRAKEVGMRKALGSERISLIYQFLVEGVTLSFLSLVLALLIALAALPLFNHLANKHIAFPFENIRFWIIVVTSGAVVGVLAGSYPAFFLSSFQPLKVLKNAVTPSGKGSTLRNSLVVFQFMISVMLIIGTGVIYTQLNYIQTKQLGFDKDQVLIVNDAYALNQQVQAFKDETKQLLNVDGSTISSFLPTPSTRAEVVFFPEGQLQQDKGVSMQKWAVDADFIKTLRLEVKQGRGFQEDFTSDSSGIVINEAAAKVLGYTSPLGKKIVMLTGDALAKRVAYTIIGVVKNFHFESLRENIGALSLVLDHSDGSVAIRLRGGDVSQTINQIDKIWKKFVPGLPFSYSFMDDNFDNVYRSEQRVGKIFVVFAVISILIACLGLFGLSAYTAERRTKEIGVRKVLGASVPDIVVLISKDFFRLVTVSIMIAIPIAWYGVNTWLREFAYHVEISWWMFVPAGLLSIVTALITVSFQSIKAALLNPVKSLKSD